MLLPTTRTARTPQMLEEREGREGLLAMLAVAQVRETADIFSWSSLGCSRRGRCKTNNNDTGLELGQHAPASCDSQLT